MTRPLIISLVLVLLAPLALAQQPTDRGNRPMRQRPRVPETLRVLHQRLPEVIMTEQPLEQVMEWLGELTRINIVVRWQTLEDNGIDRDAPVSIKARNLRLSQVLWLIMNEVGGSEVKLAYRISGSLLILSTEEDLSKEMVTKVYDIADLLINVPRASRMASFDVTQGMGQQGAGQGGGGGQGMFGESNQQGGQRGGQDQYDQGGADLQMEELLDLIQSTVEPDSWRVNNGLGTIHSFQRLIIVHNTILVHQRLGGYLTDDEVVGP